MVLAFPDPRPAASVTEPPDLTGVRVLVVEDDADVRLFLSLALQLFGAEVKGAASAREAMETLASFKPRVLISDVAMPGENGFTFIHRVRLLKKEEGGDIPAIAVTAIHTEAEDRARLLWSGFQMYVRKPLDPRDLADRVAKLANPHPAPAKAVRIA